MLEQLHVKNLAVIEDAVVRFGAGLTCVTGETGAGKSLLIGALQALLAQRPAAGMLRDGEKEGRISGLFHLADPELAWQVASAAGLCGDPHDAAELTERAEGYPDSICDGQLLLARRILASGRSSYTFNGEPLTATMVGRVGRLLLDVHGQNDQQSLLAGAKQLEVLDRYAGCCDLRREFALRRRELAELHEELLEARTGLQLREQQLEMARLVACEIDEVEPVAGEFEQLQQQHRALSNRSRLQGGAEQLSMLLSESERPVLSELQAALGLVRELVDLDAKLEPVGETLRSAVVLVQDAAFDLGRYAARLEFEPDEQREIDDRLNALNRLVHRHGRGGGIDAVLARRAELALEIKALEQGAGRGKDLEQRIQGLTAELQQIGLRLGKARRAVAAKLASLVGKRLEGLGLASCRFELQFEAVESSGSMPGCASGLERLEMLVGLNPGQPMQALSKVASGGELSRVILAIRSILADADPVAVLVFDEIDANIGGRLGTVIGRRLEEVAGSRQVLCITHQPQIAAFASSHLKVVKQVESGQTRTAIVQLESAEERTEELAEMLAGADRSAVTREQAEELLARGKASRPAPRLAGTTPEPDEPQPKPRRRSRSKSPAKGAVSKSPRLRISA